eukprot:TRINITY_DN81079_c0_g1_i1.p1 TRINITY_DN81079_c0_g1~~TRINITY_DN81079_c0_g1_i1.p1  ORF type:complete len:204 (+),score=4.00 TRINITY_DN81079_c0_g1_i1:29-640(+)
MGFCHECGTTLAAGSRFCHECGTSQAQPTPAGTGPPRRNSPTKRPATNRSAPLSRSYDSGRNRSPVKTSYRPRSTYSSAGPREYIDGSGNMQMHGFRPLYSGPSKHSPANLVDNPFDPRVGSGGTRGGRLDEKSNFCSPGNSMYQPYYARANVSHAVRQAKADHAAFGYPTSAYSNTGAHGGGLDAKSNACSPDNPMYRPAYT